MHPIRLALALSATDPAPELPPPAAPAEEHRESRVLAGCSGVMVVGSAVLFSVAGVQASGMDDATTAEDLEVSRRRTNAWAGAGGGALAVAGGLGVAAIVRW